MYDYYNSHRIFRFKIFQQFLQNFGKHVNFFKIFESLFPQIIPKRSGKTDSTFPQKFRPKIFLTFAFKIAEYIFPQIISQMQEKLSPIFS